MGNVIIGSGRLLALRFIAPSVLVAVPVTIFVPIAILSLSLSLLRSLSGFSAEGRFMSSLSGCWAAARGERHGTAKNNDSTRKVLRKLRRSSVRGEIFKVILVPPVYSSLPACDQ